MTQTPTPADPGVDDVVERVRAWLASDDGEQDRSAASARRLAQLLDDRDGLDFTVAFVDRVIRPEDLRVAARNLEAISRRAPRFLPWYLRAAIVAGGGFGILLPWPIIPIARRVFRGMVGHLVVDAAPRHLERTLARLREDGTRLNINLLGEAVLGEAEAERRLTGIARLLERPDVDYVSVKLSAVASHLALWDFENTVEQLVARLTPLYEQAAAARTPKFINLDMEEYRDLDLTIAVFTRLLEQPALRDLEAGIVLQAYLPDALGAYEELSGWARTRVAEGGAGIKVRLVKGANLPMERVDAAVHGWELATWPSKRDTDAHYKRILRTALTPRNAEAVRIGVAGHNLFDLAYAHLLAEARGVADRVEFEMLLGMAPEHQRAVHAATGGLLLYTPVVPAEEFDSAISYLVRRLDEAASDENFLSGAFALDDSSIFARERDRFASSLADADRLPPESSRTQNRLARVEPRDEQRDGLGFVAEPDTDPARAGNRAWARRVIESSAGEPGEALGAATIAAARITDDARLDRVLAEGRAAGLAWRERPAAERAEMLERVADALAANRDRLIAVSMSETGKTFGEADVEVSEAVDFARHAAVEAVRLESVESASFEASPLTLVVPPWNFAVSIPTGGVVSALGAGGAVILKPAPQARRCGAVIAEVLHAAGVPAGLLQLVDVEESSEPGSLSRRLVTAPEISRVVLTGSIETARLFRSWRHDLVVHAETSGKNAVIVTPEADLDLAVKDVAHSAFGNAGQKCSAASLVILVGSVGRSERFRRQLVDAVSGLHVAWPQDAAAEVGPLVEAPGDKLERALTRLDGDETWLVEPAALDDSGRLWSPGVRDGVAAGSWFHRTEAFGPVLGIIGVETLDEAIAVQNATDFGLTAGIHSLDAAEVAQWLDRVEAGNLYVNRGITGAIVGRQPFGGWKLSSVGPGAKAGGPNTLAVLGDWRPVPVGELDELHLDGLASPVRALVEAAQSVIPVEDFARIRAAVFDDDAVWRREFGRAIDGLDLGVERNVMRYRPAASVIRLAEGAAPWQLIRVLAAGVLVGAPIEVSSAEPLPSRVRAVVDQLGLPIVVAEPETDAGWSARMASERPARVRLLGGDAVALAEALAGAPEVTVRSGAVTGSGRVEMLAFLAEQSVTITAHRFGTPFPALRDLEL